MSTSISTESQIQRIREQIAKIRVQSYQCDEPLASRLTEGSKYLLDVILNDIQIEALEWVLRDLFGVTP